VALANPFCLHACGIPAGRAMRVEPIAVVTASKSTSLAAYLGIISFYRGLKRTTKYACDEFPENNCARSALNIDHRFLRCE
jgi:hypothetical protein